MFNLITVLGPTASGKTKLAVKLANKFNGEIISADSRQVYVGMDIGTGKDISEFSTGDRKINYHLIDILDPMDEYNLFDFQNDFFAVHEKISKEGKIPILTGGTGLYLSSILQNYKLSKKKSDSSRVEELNSLTTLELQNILLSLNKELHNTTDLLVKERIIDAIIIAESDNDFAIRKYEIESLNIGIKIDRQLNKQLITRRLKKRFDEGMIEEVERLLLNNVKYERLILFGLEYKFIAMYLKKKLSYNDMFQKLNSSIHKFAKRQMTWFRKMEREGVKIHWIEANDLNTAVKLVKETFSP